MDTPAFTLTITHLTAGWTRTSVHRVKPADTDRSVLVGPFKHAFGFVSDQVPGHLIPSTVSFSLWSRGAADDPQVEQGDLLRVVLRLGAAGPLLLNRVMRCTSSELELVANSGWPSRSAVVLADLLVDLPSSPIGDPLNKYPNRVRVRDRLAWFGFQLSRSIGVPNAWADDYAGFLCKYWPQGQTADKFASELLNAVQPVPGIHNTLTAVHAPTGYPAGYKWAYAPGAPPLDIGPERYQADASVPVDANSPVRYLVTPAGRVATSAVPLPLRFQLVGTIATVTGAAVSGSSLSVALNAAWCVVPAKARRGREHQSNTADIGGYERTNVFIGEEYTGPRQRAARRVRTTPDAATRGPITRTVETQLEFGPFNPNDQAAPVVDDANVATQLNQIAATFLPPAADSTWTFDAFQVTTKNMTQADAETLLPKLIPAYPGEGSDGQVVRHLTVYNLDPDVRMAGQPVSGFITRGEVAINDGNLSLSLTTAPGRHTGALVAVTPATVGDAQTATWGAALTVPPNTTVADLDYIGA